MDRPVEIDAADVREGREPREGTDDGHEGEQPGGAGYGGGYAVKSGGQAGEDEAVGVVGEPAEFLLMELNQLSQWQHHNIRHQHR